MQFEAILVTGGQLCLQFCLTFYSPSRWRSSRRQNSHMEAKSVSPGVGSVPNTTVPDSRESWSKNRELDVHLLLNLNQNLDWTR